MGGSNIMIRFKSPVLLLLLLLASCGRATTGSDPHGTVVLRDGTTITGTVLSTSSKEIQVVGEVSRDVVDRNGDVVIPRGANAQIVIRSVSHGGRIRSASDLVLDLASVSVDGKRYELRTTDVAARGKEGIGRNKRTAEYTG